MATDNKNKFGSAIAQGLMAGGDAISGIYGQRGNTYGNYLDAQAKRQQMAWEAERYQMENDPRVQAGKLASTMAMLGDTAAAERLMSFANSEKIQPGIQPTSQISQPQESIIPDYLGAGRPSLSSQNIRPGVVAPIMGSGMGFGVKSINPKGGVSLGPQKDTMNPYDAKNLDIASTLKTEELKKQQETTTGVETMAGGFGNYLDQYERSYNEVINKYPEIGKTGFYGKLDRFSGKISKALDELPETKSMEKMAKPFAQEIATSLEGRATDADRQIWLDVFPNVLTGPTQENVRTASNLLIGMQTKLKGSGKDVNDVVSLLYNSKTKPMKMIAEQFYTKFPELKSKAIGIPDGWEIVNE